MKYKTICRDILKAILITGGIVLILTSPTGTQRLLKEIPKELKKYKRKQLWRALYYLRSKNRIRIIRENNGGVEIEITRAGKKYLKNIDFDNLSLTKPNVWDKKWRMVIFDIPEKKKKAREALRQKLKDLNLVKLQDSVWVTPYPCEDEISFIKSIFNLSDYWLDVIISDNIGAQEYRLRKLFNLL
mgnify:CR=1 FL=1